MTEAGDNSDETDAITPPSDFSRVYVEHLTITNFRGIGSAAIKLEPHLTLLVGMNNSGKSRVLRALAIALGASSAEKDDLTVPSQEVATIDVVIAPLGAPAEEGSHSFDEGAFRRIGADVQPVSEEPPIERFAWRTYVEPSAEGYGAKSRTAVLYFDNNAASWQPLSPSRGLTREQRALLAADSVATHRDLADDLSRRGSAVRRVLDDLEVPAESRSSLEDQLTQVGRKIVESSESLGGIKNSLDQLSDSVAGIGTPDLQPLPVSLEELTRSVSIGLDNGGGSLPLRFHGAGARSLAALQVQGVLYDRRLGKDGPALRPRPVSLVEEPESHLHPQAQFELDGLLGRMPGQVVVSTHSTHLASVCPPDSLRLLQPRGQALRIVDLKALPSGHGSTERARDPLLHAEEMSKLKRLVERPFGELLFATYLVIGDGATERALIPPVLRHALREKAHGVCVIDPGSMDDPLAIAAVKFANLAGIEWVLFSDADKKGLGASQRLVDSYGDGDAERVVSIGKDIATEQMFISFSPDLCERVAAELGRQDEELLRFMGSKKGVLGSLLAQELVENFPWKNPEDRPAGYWPEPLANLCDKLSKSITARESDP